MTDQRTAGVPPADVAASRAATPRPAAGRCRDSRRGRRRSALFLLLFTLPLHAALTSSAITGRVTGGDAPAAGVTVTATAAVLQQPRTTVTGPRGTYWIGALPPGTYDVTFSRAGMTTLTRRAVVELGRVARADARLEPSADEESVTSTALQTSVADTTAITSHFGDETLDRFPGRDYAAALAPNAYTPSVADIDGLPAFFAGAAVSEEASEQVTAVRGAAPVEVESYGGAMFALRTRSGREEFFLSLRDTVSSGAWMEGGPFLDRDDGLQNFFEAHGGGRIVSRRLWFFAALWSGDDATRYSSGRRGGQVKLHAQLGAANHVDAVYTTGRSSQYGFSDSWSASLRHTGVFGPRLTTETIAGRSSMQTVFPPSPAGPAGPRQRGHFLSTRASYALPARHGDHVLTVGGTVWDIEAFDTHSFFVSDRWSGGRWVVNAGLRYDETPFRGGDFTPRAAVTYDLRGDGRRAIAASFGEYTLGISPAGPVRIATLGYAAAIGSSGTARIDLIRSDKSFGFATDSVQLDARYRLFDRFEAGATYAYARPEDDHVLPIVPTHHGNAWLGAQLPIGAHEVGVTVVQRYVQLQGYNPGTGTVVDTLTPTDLALRYAIPFTRAGLMLAADATNVFGSDTHATPRGVRLWARLRM